MKSFFVCMLIFFVGNFYEAFASDAGPTIAQLPDTPHVVILPDGSVSFLHPEQPYQPQIFQGTPLNFNGVMALHTGREKFKRYGGGYHQPIKDRIEEYKAHITRNPGINHDEDYQTQDILSKLKCAVLYCNQKYPKVSSLRA